MNAYERRRGLERVGAGGPGRFGMTLPELLVAIAILSILFGLLIVPVMKAFGYIRTSSVRVEAQSIGRTVFEMLTREISDALYIYDNKDDPTESTLIFVAPQGAGSNVPGANAPGLPVLIQPGPGSELNVQPLIKHLQVALTRTVDGNGNLLPYWNQWEMESSDLRGAGLSDIPSSPPADNLYRLVYAEYFLPNSTGSPDPNAAPFLLTNVLGALYPSGQPDAFREPGFLDDSLLLRKPRGGVTGLCNSRDAAERRRLLEYSGLLVGLTPRDNVDMAWASYNPGSADPWQAKPGVQFESLSVANESLAPVTTGATVYPSAYRADYGHWQTVRRKDWSTPQPLAPWARFFQVFDVRVGQRYDSNAGSRTRDYYVSIGRTDSVSGVPPSDPRGYYVFRMTGGVPVEGVWPDTDRPVFNMTLYRERIDRWRRRANEDPVSFWNENDPYGGNDTTLNLLPRTDDTKPYWPQMAFLLNADLGTVDFRVDAPVRPPMPNQPQPPGPLAPFQVPYDGPGTGWDQPAPDGVRTVWVIPDVRLARADANAPQNRPPFQEYNNGDALGTDENTTWIRIPAETMRVMVSTDGGDTWVSYTRVRQHPGPREFAFDEETGLLSFDQNNYAGEWAGYATTPIQIRAWYQIQTNVQRRTQSDALESTNGHTVTASYFTKEVLRLTLALRAYDQDTGKAQSFQLSATVRPRNLR